MQINFMFVLSITQPVTYMLDNLFRRVNLKLECWWKTVYYF